MADRGQRPEILEDARVTYHTEFQGQFIVVENVPAQTNVETGEEYFSPDTVDRLQEIIWEQPPPQRTIQVPVYEYDSSCDPTADPKQRRTQGPKRRLRARLLNTFEFTRSADGTVPTAQDLIEAALQSSEHPQVLEWMRDYCLDAKRPKFAADVLRHLARLPSPGKASWRAELVHCALAMDDPAIRDAAVQAAERWGGTDVLRVLEAHNDPLPSIRLYAKNVIEGLRVAA